MIYLVFHLLMQIPELLLVMKEQFSEPQTAEQRGLHKQAERQMNYGVSHLLMQIRELLLVVYGTILRTTNGGTTWTSQTSGTTNELWGVSFTDANTGTAVGSEGTILRTTNGGTTWTSQTSGTTNQLFGVSFADANTGTAVGDGGNNSTYQQMVVFL